MPCDESVTILREHLLQRFIMFKIQFTTLQVFAIQVRTLTTPTNVTRRSGDSLIEAGCQIVTAHLDMMPVHKNLGFSFYYSPTILLF